MSDSGVPVIDLSPTLKGSTASTRNIALKIGEVCESIGFMTFVGHGISESLIADMRAVSKAFFDLPETVKRQVLSKPKEKQFAGYVPFALDSAAVLRSDKQPPADLRERYRVALTEASEIHDFVGREQFPVEPAEFADIWRRYYAAIEELSARVIRLCSQALDMGENGLDPYFDRHFSVLVAANSPAVQGDLLPGQIRCGEHTDFGTLTFVHQESDVGGLQILRDGEWRDVMPVPGSYSVNIGDLMARWTNDRWTSTVHRVANSSAASEAAGKKSGSDRLSLIYFNQPNLDSEIRCLPTCTGAGNPPKYEPITLRQHFAAQQKRLIDKQTELAKAS